MATTPNLSLYLWEPNEDFSGSQLQSNWKAIDRHDHGANGGAKLTSESLGKEIVTTEKIAEGAVTEVKLDSSIAHGIVPLGAVIAWYPPKEVNIPGGAFEICDGREWKAITNSLGYSSGKIPDLRNKFILGGTVAGIEGGVEKINFAHSHSVLPHSHSIPQHTHNISTDGAHNHGFFGEYQGYGGEYKSVEVTLKQHYTGPPGFKEEREFEEALEREAIILKAHFESGEPWGAKNFSIDQVRQRLKDEGKNKGEEEVSPLEIVCGTKGAHNHGGSTELSAPANTGSETALTNNELGEKNIMPPYYSMVYIMRVR